MAELENLLLQAAGRTGTSTSNNQSHAYSRWQREGSGSESKEDNSDNSRFNKRKLSGSRIFLKKKLEPPGKDKKRNLVHVNDNGFTGDDSDSAPSFGSDLYKNEADKEELSKISELKREMILAERSAKMDDYFLKKRAMVSSPKVENSREENPPPFLSHGRSSVRKERPDAKTDALNELRAKRMRQQEPESYHMLKNLVGVTVSSSVNKDSSPSKRHSIPIPEPDSSESDDGNEDKLAEDIDIDDSLDDLLASKSRPISYEEVKEITIRRSKLAKWLMEPFFEKIIVGCFVRVGIGKTRNGPKYRLCVIKNVDATELNRQYKLEGLTTCKWLNCIWGSEASAARWQMAMVSDSLPTEEEFKEWLTEVQRNGGRIPCLQDVDDKKEEIQKASTFVYSAETVKKMVDEKKLISSRPLNVAVEKVLLKREIEIVESSGKEIEAERLRAKLKEMEDLSKQIKPNDLKAVRLLEMNRKNRVENYKNASEVKPVNTNLKVGEEGYDPFSRRWTRSRDYFYTPKLEEDSNGETANGGNGHEVDVKPMEVDEVATTTTLEEASDVGKLITTCAPVDRVIDLYALHDFDLPISLAGLNKFGGPLGVHRGFMARKQKIEATIGNRVPDNYRRRNVLTISVSDYKRRRDLL